MSDNGETMILRYRKRQRFIHALMASSFLVLLFTGLALVWSPLSWIAAGGWSRYLHRIAAVGFIAVPILYVILHREGAKEIVRESFSYDRDDISWFSKMYRYAAGRTSEMPPQGRLNAGQKLHHAAVMVFSALIVITGAMLWWLKADLTPTQLAWTGIVHDVSMLLLTLLLVGHVFFTYVYTAWSSMTTGYVSRDDMVLEHAKWVDELETAAVDEASA